MRRGVVGQSCGDVTNRRAVAGPRSRVSIPSTTAVPANNTSNRPDSVRPDDAADLHELLAQVASEASTTLTSAIERVNTLAHTGRIDRAGLRTLREELERARRVGMLGQQVSRIASPRVRVYEEKVDLTTLLRDLMMQRQREFEAKRIAVEPRLLQVTVVSDVTLIFAMLGAWLDWCLEHVQGALDLTLEVNGQTGRAELTCSFAPAREDAARIVQSKTMSWRLVEVCAHKLELPLERREQGPQLTLRLEFPKTVLATESLDTLLDPGPEAEPSTHNSRPLAGTHLLVVCGRRDLRVEIREAVQSMGLMLDFVANVAEAREFCAAGLPHAIVYEAAQGGAPMQRLAGELRADAPTLAFVEIVESGKPIQASMLGGLELSSVARPAVREALPTALNFELARVG